MTQNQNHTDGFNAFSAGVKWWENPHESGSLAAMQWDEGHTAARKTYPFVTYLRREPTTDATTHKYAPRLIGKVKDVQSYRDPEAREKGMARWPWDYTKSKPTRRNKWVTMGCVKHRIIWLPDL